MRTSTENRLVQMSQTCGGGGEEVTVDPVQDKILSFRFFAQNKIVIENEE